jgi:hypothetical protein
MWRSGQSRRGLFSRRAVTVEDLLQDHAARGGQKNRKPKPETEKTETETE